MQLIVTPPVVISMRIGKEYPCCVHLDDKVHVIYINVLFLKFRQIHNLKIDLSETAIEPENNNIFKHTRSNKF